MSYQSTNFVSAFLLQPWQVVLQTVKTGKNGANYVEDTVVYTSDERPSYNDALAKLLEGARAISTQ